MVDTVALDAPEALDRIGDVLTDGGVVAVPTDTVYGLAARPTDPRAMERLFAAKGRPASVPVAVLVAGIEQARTIVERFPPEAERWIADWWPGPLTLVCGRRRGIDFSIGDPVDTVGVRCPDDDLLRTLLERVGPLAATSANRHGDETLASASVIVDVLGDEIDLVVDGGDRPATASTVVAVTGDVPVVLRRGGLDPAVLGLA